MSDYKIVDASRLDGDLTVLADAIRQRSGTNGKLEFPAGMADAVKNISSETVLPKLDNPGSSGDLAMGKQMIDASGNVVIGTIPPAHDMYADIDEENIWEDNGGLHAYWSYSGEKAIMNPSDTEMISVIPLSVLGNALPGDVAKGKSFTSSAGIHVEGTLEPQPVGGGLPEGLLEYEIQTFTPEKDTNEEQTFSLNMEKTPTLISIATDMPTLISRSFVSFDGCRPNSGDSAVKMDGTFRSYTPSMMQASASSVAASSNPSGIMNLTNKSFTIRTNFYGGQYTYFRAGYTYTIIAMRLVTNGFST